MDEVRRPSADIFDENDFPMSLVRRTIFSGTGRNMDETAKKPLVAIACSETEMNPGHMHLGSIAARVRDGVISAGGAPFSFNVPAPCDGIAMGHAGMRFVLAQRDLIADMVETHVRSMRFDAVVFIASCDKIIPGMLMAAARLDLPAIFITGGPNAFDVRFSPLFKGSVSHKDYDDLNAKLATARCATCGACEIMGTANTFQCLAEVLGMTLPGSANVPAYHAEKLRFAEKTGARAVEMVKEGLCAKKIMTEKSLLNAVMADLAMGGSTNATLHLPALAKSLGLDLPVSVFNDFNRKIPTLLGIAPNGPHGITDLYAAGGIPALLKRLSGVLHADALTATGKTIGQVAAEAVIADESVIPPVENPRLPEGGTVILTGNLAPDCAVVKQSAVAADMRVFTGPARVFESEADCLSAIRAQSLSEGEVLIIRNEGPKGAAGMPEMLAVTMALELYGFKRVALVTDGRFSGATAGPCVGHVSPEAFSGGPIAYLKNGDMVTIDIPARSLSVAVSEAGMAERKKSMTPVVRPVPPGYMERYRKHVTSAASGAVLE